ncbi:hypothetical protein BLNAU_20280 [Blattamonas nauphoetae]|uniref:Protein kinase domain-containing protein n=1 Tax=Blattamonas nauphoetae TaxID=2049346 RepID=A0ABQ9WZ75_9EUKA|nr:hypothetical protein BLNAU_20280 [Blattamonas nauphoetae]
MDTVMLCSIGIMIVIWLFVRHILSFRNAQSADEMLFENEEYETLESITFKLPVGQIIEYKLVDTDFGTNWEKGENRTLMIDPIFAGKGTLTLKLTFHDIVSITLTEEDYRLGKGETFTFVKENQEEERIARKRADEEERRRPQEEKEKIAKEKAKEEERVRNEEDVRLAREQAEQNEKEKREKEDEKNKQKEEDKMTKVQPKPKSKNRFEVKVPEPYKFVRTLGQGRFGSVHEVSKTPSDEHFAMKILPFTSESDFKKNEHEIAKLSKYQHRNVVGFVEAIKGDTAHYVVLELCSHSLQSEISENQKLGGKMDVVVCASRFFISIYLIEYLISSCYLCHDL